MENGKLLNLKNAALKEISEANSVDSLNAVRNTYLSKFKTLLHNFICNMFFYAIINSEFESEDAYGKRQIIKIKRNRSCRNRKC